MESLPLTTWCRLQGPFGAHDTHFCPLPLDPTTVNWASVRVLRFGSPMPQAPVLDQITGPDQAVAYAPEPCVFVSGFDPSAAYEFRYEILATPAPPPDGLPLSAGACRLRAVKLSIRETAGVARTGEIVSFGFPCKIGELLSPANVRVLGPADDEVISQAAVLARWADGSIRWLLISVPVDVSGDAAPQYTVEYGNAVSRAPIAEGVSVSEDDDNIVIDTGLAQATVSKTRFQGISRLRIDGAEVFVASAEHGLFVTEPGGRRFAAHLEPPERVIVEEAGPARAMIMVEGWHANADGLRLLKYVCRIEAFAGRRDFKIRHTFVNQDVDCPTCVIAASDRPDHSFEVQYLPVSGISMRLPTPRPAGSYAAALTDGEPLHGDVHEAAAITQQRHDHCELEVGGSCNEYGARLENWLDAGGLTLAVQHLWQLFPKRLRVDGFGMEVMLVPASDEQPFRAYRGMARTHEVLLRCHGDEAPEQARRAARAFEYPLTAVVPSVWFDETAAMGRLGRRDLRRFRKYDHETELGRTLRQQDRRHHYAAWEYGMLNYGDWFGGALGGDNPDRDKSGNSYGCQEYDYMQAFCQAFVRSGDPDDLREASIAAAHRADVDTRHDNADPALIGSQSTHNGPEHVTAHDYCSHAWVTGLLNYYYLTGDRRSLEAALLNGAARLRNMDPDFIRAQGAERQVGWPVIEAAPLFEYRWEARYLEHMRAFRDAVLQNQQYGEFPFYSLKRNVDEPQGFMNYIVYEGLVAYWRVTGDTKVAHAILQAAQRIQEELELDNREFINFGLDVLGAAFEISGNFDFLHKGVALYETRRFHCGWGKGLAQGRKGASEFLSVVEHSGPLYIWVQTERVELGGQEPFEVRVRATSLVEEPQRVKLSWAGLPAHIKVDPAVGEFELAPQRPSEVAFSLTGPDTAEAAGSVWAAVVVEYSGGSQHWAIPVSWRPAPEQIEVEIVPEALGFSRSPRLVLDGAHRSGRPRWRVLSTPPDEKPCYFKVEREDDYAFGAVMLDDALDHQSFFVEVDDQPLPGLRLAEDAADWDDYPLYREGLMAGPITHLRRGYHKLTIHRYASMNRAGTLILPRIILGPVREGIATFITPARALVGEGQEISMMVAVANFNDTPVPVTLAPYGVPCGPLMEVGDEPVTVPGRALKQLRLTLAAPQGCPTQEYKSYLDVRTPRFAIPRSLLIRTIGARRRIEIQGELAETMRYGSHPVICHEAQSGYALEATWPSGRWFAEPGYPGALYVGHRWHFEIGREQEYTLWMRVRWDTATWGNPEFFPRNYQAWIGFDGEESTELDGSALVGKWTWMRGPTQRLTIGEHFANWSNGWVMALIDKLVISADADLMPED